MFKYITYYKLLNFTFNIIIVFFIINISEEKINVIDEDQFKKSLENEDEIFISNSFKINDKISLFQKEIINITSKENNVIDFNNSFENLIYMDSIKEINITNISIAGKIITNNVNKIYFKNVKIIGEMVSYNNIKNSSYIFENCNFISSNYEIDNKIINGFEFYNTKTIFKNCTFIGSKNVKNIVYFLGIDILYNSIEIYDSNFNGDYNSLCFNGNNSNIIIRNSKFINCNDKYLDHGYI